MKALKCKTLGAEFATELLVGNGRRMNKSQQVVGFTERSRQYLQLQMAARLYNNNGFTAHITT